MFVAISKDRQVICTQVVDPTSSVNLDEIDVFQLPVGMSESSLFDENGPVVLPQVVYDELTQPTKKEKAIASLKSMKSKGKDFDLDALIDAVVAAIED